MDKRKSKIKNQNRDALHPVWTCCPVGRRRILRRLTVPHVPVRLFCLLCWLGLALVALPDGARQVRQGPCPDLPVQCARLVCCAPLPAIDTAASPCCVRRLSLHPLVVSHNIAEEEERYKGGGKKGKRARGQEGNMDGVRISRATGSRPLHRRRQNMPCRRQKASKRSEAGFPAPLLWVSPAAPLLPQPSHQMPLATAALSHSPGKTSDEAGVTYDAHASHASHLPSAPPARRPKRRHRGLAAPCPLVCFDRPRLRAPCGMIALWAHARPPGCLLAGATHSVCVW